MNNIAYFLAKAFTLIYYKLQKAQNNVPSHLLSEIRRTFSQQNSPDSSLYNPEVPNKITSTTLVFDMRYVVLHCLAEGLYRVFHDLWTLLQEVISWVFVIKKFA